MDTKELIERVKIHRYEKCNEFSTPLMNEVIERLEEYERTMKVIEEIRSCVFERLVNK